MGFWSIGHSILQNHSLKTHLGSPWVRTRGLNEELRRKSKTLRRRKLLWASAWWCGIASWLQLAQLIENILVDRCKVGGMLLFIHPDDCGAIKTFQMFHIRKSSTVIFLRPCTFKFACPFTRTFITATCPSWAANCIGVKSVSTQSFAASSSAARREQPKAKCQSRYISQLSGSCTLVNGP